MCKFIEDYLADPSLAVSTMRKEADASKRYDAIKEAAVEAELQSPEFRLYSQIILS